jgi:uncharacterized repeat protein (TIGR04138 family)
MYHPKIDELIRRDPRYPLEAYEFIFAALTHTQRLLGRRMPLDPARQEDEQHVTGPQLLHGARDLALHEFGYLARTVFRMWGINNTSDFGEIVFNLITVGLMTKTDRDDLSDFADVYDLDEALGDYRVVVPQEAEES